MALRHLLCIFKLIVGASNMDNEPNFIFPNGQIIYLNNSKEYLLVLSSNTKIIKCFIAINTIGLYDLICNAINDIECFIKLFSFNKSFCIIDDILFDIRDIKNISFHFLLEQYSNNEITYISQLSEAKIEELISMHESYNDYITYVEYVNHITNFSKNILDDLYSKDDIYQPDIIYSNDNTNPLFIKDGDKNEE